MILTSFETTILHAFSPLGVGLDVYEMVSSQRDIQMIECIDWTKKD